MEEYKVKDLNIGKEIKVGRYSNLVLTKYELKFGYDNKKRMRENGFKILDKLLTNNDTNNNMLLVGKVQSGKTSNLEFLTGLMFDIGFDLLILYGGYDTKLLEQTYKRFTKTFDFNEEDDLSPLIISTSESHKIQSLNEDIIERLIKIKRPIILISMKRPNALKKINSILKQIHYKVNAFIIDDEGDQASLNTRINKKVASATYNTINDMKNLLKNPPYFSVTATPHANVLLGEYSILKPNDVVLLPPAPGYTGSVTFHLDESKLITVPDSDIDFMDQGEFTDSLKNGIYHFIISSSIMKKRGIYKADMIIHSDRLVEKHNYVYNKVTEFINTLHNTMNVSFEENYFIDEMKGIYNENFFDKQILDTYSFEEVLSEYKNVIKNTYIILQNGLGKSTQQLAYLKPYKIYIGGDLLQRGLTFENLVTTFFTRWAQQGSMDTVIQRARWFGYRSKYIELCRIFTTKNIFVEFAALATSEIELWDQLYDVESGNKKIDDIIIDGSLSSLIPTRPNRVQYEQNTFNTKWKNQRIGIFDPNIIKENNMYVNEYIKNKQWIPSSIGRRDQQNSCHYNYANRDDFIELVRNIKESFDYPPFDKANIEKVVRGRKVVIQLMYSLDDPNDIRKRSFGSDYKVSALQQGADTEDESKKKYEGDRYVIVDKEAVCVQIFKILSKDRLNEPDKYTQYMFSIYVPFSYQGYKRLKYAK